MVRNYVRLLAGVGLTALFSLATSSPALAQAYLGGNLTPYAVMAGTTVTCTESAGAATINGEVGVSPGSALVGFGGAPCDAGTLRTPPASDAGKAELVTAYNTLNALPCASTVGPDLAGLTLTPGVYCVGAAVSNLTGTLTLDFQGNANAVFVFQMSSTLITSPNSIVGLTNTAGGAATACQVQWQVDSSATLDTNTTFVGNILALTAITMNAGARLTGRALARNAAVTLDSNTISFAACGAGAGPGGAPPPFPPIGVPTLPEIGKWALLMLLVGSGVYLVSRRSGAAGGD